MQHELYNLQKITFSTLERYKKTYLILSELDLFDREFIKNAASERLEKIYNEPKKIETKKLLETCLRFQYLARYHYEIFGDDKPYNSEFEKNEFKKNIKALIGLHKYDIHDYQILNKEHGQDFVNNLIDKNNLLAEKFGKALSNRKDFFEIIPKLLFRDNYGLTEVIEFVTKESNSLEFPKNNISFNVWEQNIDHFLNQKWFYEKCINNHKKSWLPSKQWILYWEEKLNKHLEDIQKFTMEVSFFYDDVQTSYLKLKEIHEEYISSFYFTEQIEVIDAINDGVKLKHFLLEKGFEMSRIYK